MMKKKRITKIKPIIKSSELERNLKKLNVNFNFLLKIKKK
jgi:hypothetical protein